MVTHRCSHSREAGPQPLGAACGHTHVLASFGHCGLLRPVDTYGDLASGRAKLLVKPPVRANPHVLFSDLHLCLIEKIAITNLFEVIFNDM